MSYSFESFRFNAEAMILQIFIDGFWSASSSNFHDVPIDFFRYIQRLVPHDIGVSAKPNPGSSWSIPQFQSFHFQFMFVQDSSVIIYILTTDKMIAYLQGPFSWLRKQQRPGALSSSILGHIPLEILLNIVTFRQIQQRHFLSHVQTSKPYSVLNTIQKSSPHTTRKSRFSIS